MFSGSGTNIKMLDYLSAGIPVVSTPVGARGIDIESRTHALVCSPEQFQESILELAGDLELQVRLSENGRRLVEKRYSWERIAKIVEEKLQEVMFS